MDTLNTCAASMDLQTLKPIIKAAEALTRRSHRAETKNVSISLNGSARIRFTNLEFIAERSIDCDHSGPDQTLLLNAGEIHKSIKSIRKGSLEIISQDRGELSGAAIVRAGAIERRIEGETSLQKSTNNKGETSARHELTDVPRIEFHGKPISLNCAEFIAAFKALSHAVDQESSRYALGGIRLESNGLTIDLAATDSRRLAYRSLKGETAWKGGIVIPAYAVEVFISLLPKKPLGEMFIWINDGIDSENAEGDQFKTVRIVLDHPGSSTHLQTPEVHGRFPRWQEVIPPTDSDCYVNRAAILEVCQQLLATQSEESRGIDVKFAGDLATFRGTGDNRGSHRIIPAAIPGHGKMTLDPRFLVDVLKVIDTDDVWISFISESIQTMETTNKKFHRWIESAILIRSTDGIHSEIIMPLSRDR